MPIKQKIIVALVLLFSAFVIVLSALYTVYGIGAVVLFVLGLYYLYLIYPKFDLNKDVSLNKRGKLIALTFDDGPTAKFTDDILKILNEKKVNATFFVIGKKAEMHKDLVSREITQGHEIGMHTFEHVKLHFKGIKFIESEITKTKAVLGPIYKDLGFPADSSKIFRAPHGFKNFSLKRYLRDNGIKLIPWTRGVWDTASPGAEWIVDKSTCNPADNEILLLHDGLGMDESVSEKQRLGVLQALPKIIDIYQSKGYRFVKVSELLK